MDTNINITKNINNTTLIFIIFLLSILVSGCSLGTLGALLSTPSALLPKEEPSVEASVQLGKSNTKSTSKQGLGIVSSSKKEEKQDTRLTSTNTKIKDSSTVQSRSIQQQVQTDKINSLEYKNTKLSESAYSHNGSNNGSNNGVRNNHKIVTSNNYWNTPVSINNRGNYLEVIGYLSYGIFISIVLVGGTILFIRKYLLL